MLVAFLMGTLLRADAGTFKDWWKGFCERHLVADEPWPGYADGYPPPQKWLMENGFYMGPWGMAEIDRGEGVDLVPRAADEAGSAETASEVGNSVGEENPTPPVRDR